MKIGLASAPFFNSVRNFFRLKEEDLFEIVKLNEIEKYDLIVFSGGADISPNIYGEENISSYTNPRRDKKEKEVFNLSKKHGKKMFGICRGHQLINAMEGGKLIQDIKSRHGGSHNLIITEENSVIGKIFKEVNSMHHQGVITAGRKLKVTSTYKGVIESTEGKHIISVQWHPEFMMDSQSIKLSNYLKEWAKNDSI